MTDNTDAPMRGLMTAMKYASRVYATDEELGYRGAPLTNAELADIRAWNAAARKRREELHTRLRAATNDPGALAVLDLHAPCDGGLSACAGCPADDMGCPEYWPCDTIEAVADAYGITITDEDVPA